VKKGEKAGEKTGKLQGKRKKILEISEDLDRNLVFNFNGRQNNTFIIFSTLLILVKTEI